jgi:Serine-pyruvate aminotransferase/archaeal aspartate aminotransferase
MRGKSRNTFYFREQLSGEKLYKSFLNPSLSLLVKKVAAADNPVKDCRVNLRWHRERYPALLKGGIFVFKGGNHMERILMTPGPTNIPEQVFEAMSINMHHRTDEFAKIIEDTGEKLKKLFGTRNDVYVISASGTGGLEASVVNLFSPDDKLLCINCGVFGKRYADIAKTFGVYVSEKVIDWGRGISEKGLEEELKKESYKAVYVTYSETSTGIKNDIKSLGSIVKRYGALFIVDIVSAIGCLPFNAEEYNVDVAIAGSQKGLMCPPGLTFISLSDSAWDAVQKSRLPKFYFDFKKYKNADMMPYTPAVSIILGLNKALSMLYEERIDNVLSRHKKYSSVIKNACKAMGLKEYPDEEFSSEVLTAVYVPEGITAKSIISKMYEQGIIIAGGQGSLKGRIIRIGHIGYIRKDHIIRTVESLGNSLDSLGYKIDTGEIVRYTEDLMEV